MSSANLKAAATGQVAPSPLAKFSSFMDKLKPQLALALPKHMNADRMARLAVTAFSTNADLQKCSPQSIAGSIMTAAQMGLEPGINGQGYLIPYKQTCTFVPGWKGLADLVSRSGRATVWTGVVMPGDKFELFEQKAQLMRLLEVAGQAEGVRIFIGGESQIVQFDDLSIVSAPYEVDGQIVGTVGVIGPTRMAYDRMIQIVDITSRDRKSVV